MQATDHIIFEGTPALAVPGIRSLPSARFSVEADEDEREALLMHDWLVVKGFSEEHARELLSFRSGREEPFIASLMQTADYGVFRRGENYHLYNILSTLS